MEFGTGRLLQKLPLGKYIAVCTILWGIVNACFAAVQNYSGAIAIRFFLGVFEASISPGFALVTAQVRIPFKKNPIHKRPLKTDCKIVVHKSRAERPHRHLGLL